MPLTLLSTGAQCLCAHCDCTTSHVSRGLSGSDSCRCNFLKATRNTASIFSTYNRHSFYQCSSVRSKIWCCCCLTRLLWAHAFRPPTDQTFKNTSLAYALGKLHVLLQTRHARLEPFKNRRWHMCHRKSASKIKPNLRTYFVCAAHTWTSAQSECASGGGMSGCPKI